MRIKVHVYVHTGGEAELDLRCVAQPWAPLPNVVRLWIRVIEAFKCWPAADSAVTCWPGDDGPMVEKAEKEVV
jgi:hypothetical protein